jgi:dodecin
VSDATYKVTEVVGTSTESIQKAVRNGIAQASKTLRHLDWFEVTGSKSPRSAATSSAATSATFR